MFTLINRKKGFTLIELLVTISIVSLLSSIVLASLKSAREKSRVAAGLKYSTHNLRTLPAVGFWKFDEVGTSVVQDGSGFSNNGAIVGANGTARSSDVAHPTKGTSFQFSGTNYAAIPSNSNLNVSSAGFTYMAWVKPTSYPNAFNMIIGRYVPYLGVNSNKLRFYLGNTCSAPYYAVSASDVEVDRWTHVAGVYDGATATVYINGKVDGTLTCAGALTNHQQEVTIGAWQTGPSAGASRDYYFNGYIDDAAILSKALVSSEVESIFAEQKNNYLAEK